MKVEHFFDKDTFTLTYVVWDQETRDAVIIDPVLNYDSSSSSFSIDSVNSLVDFTRERNLNVHFVLETHAHADHLSGAQELKRHMGVIKVAIRQEITKVQNTFKNIFAFGDNFKTNGDQFDYLFQANEKISAGSLLVDALPTPGHTEACTSYLIQDAVFTGDAIFMPDYGTGRCDFPGGDAATLFASINQTLYQLPASTRVFVGHDYLPGGRPLRYETTIADQKANNVQLNAATTKEDFVKFRRARDQELAPPKLLFPSVQVNIAAGQLPEIESNGTRYLKIPLSKRG